MSKRSSGQLGEDLATNFLQEKGYKILCRNFHSRLGEIDIIAQEQNVLVFVEVKTRWNKSFGLPEEAISHRKITSIIKTGQYFKLLHPNLPDSLRIDAVVIEMKEGKVERMELIMNLTS